MKKCCTCKKEKDLEGFNRSSRSKDGRQAQCRQCSKDHYSANSGRYKQQIAVTKQARKIEIRKFLRDYLLAHPCVDCGETDPIVLDFDHVRGRKIMDICTMIKHGAFARIRAEVEKCDIRCANCHRRKTAREFGYHSWLASEGSCSSMEQSTRLLSASM